MKGESLMKNTLRLMTIFMGIIGGCAAILVVFILAVYPNLNHNTLIKNNETPSEVIAIATDNTSIDNKQNENSSSSEHTDITNLPSETESDTKPIKSGTYNIDDIEFWFSDSVRNDITGNWRIASIASSKDITDYVIDYYNTLFSSNDEIHAIVNFSLNTTSSISVLYNGILDVSIHEYIDGEEHDAKALFGGMLLKEYWVNTETGEIEDISMPAHSDQEPLVSDNEQIHSTEPQESGSIDNNSSPTVIPTEENSTDINFPTSTAAENPIQSSGSQGTSGDESNFNTYNNPEQQQTSALYVLNTSSMKIHYPSCSSVKQIAPQNYATSNSSTEDLRAQGYTTCGKCFK